MKYESENSSKAARPGVPAVRPGADGPHGQPPSEYKAIDVACGPYCTFVVGRLREDPFIQVDEPECKDILKELERFLRRDGSLLPFFEGPKASGGAKRGAGAAQSRGNAGGAGNGRQNAQGG